MDCCRIRVFSLRCDVIISADVKSLRRINFQMNFQMKVYSQVAYEMIEIWHRTYYVSLTTSDPDTVAKNIKKWYENGRTLYYRTKNIQWSTWITTEKNRATVGIVDFQPISSLHFPHLPEEVVEDFNWDQHLLYRFVRCRPLSEGSGMMILLHVHVCKNLAISTIPNA